MIGGAVIFAFDPVPELEGRQGLLVCSIELAQRLVSEHRAELVPNHIHDALRYVSGSASNRAAALALRESRGLVDPQTLHARARKPAKMPRLEG